MQYFGDILGIFLKQKFVECSLNILETLLCGYRNLAKDRHLLLSSHTFLTQKQIQKVCLKIFSLKCSLNVTWMPGTMQRWGNTEGILPEYSVPAGIELNVSQPWVYKTILTRSDILGSKYHKCTGFHGYLEFTINFSSFYLFDCKFVDLMTFSFFQGKICVPEKSGVICQSLFLGFITSSSFKKNLYVIKNNIKAFVPQHIFIPRIIGELKFMQALMVKWNSLCTISIFVKHANK